MLLADGQQIELDAARREMIQHLIGGAACPARLLQQLLQIVDVKIRNAPAQDFALLLKGFHCANSLFKRHVAAPVQQIEIQPVGAESPQAALAGVNRIRFACVPGI